MIRFRVMLAKTRMAKDLKSEWRRLFWSESGLAEKNLFNLSLAKINCLKTIELNEVIVEF
jgi:hypothetical protein